MDVQDDDSVAKAVEQAGEVDGMVFGPLQAPAAPPLEQWEADPPIHRVGLDDPGWEWGGDWAEETFEKPWGKWTVKKTTTPGAEATFTFEGTFEDGRFRERLFQFVIRAAQ